MEKRKQIGILGGTFDPIHIGHLILAQEACEQLSLDQVWFMPNAQPPHKQQRRGGASDAQRLEMVRLAIADDPRFALCMEEMDARMIHYTWQTMTTLCGKYPDTDFTFLTGADSLFCLETWKRPEEICRLCTLASGVRNHIPAADMRAQAELLRNKYGARIRLLDTRNVDISSSDIREKLFAGRSVRYYVPDSVLNYILEVNCYEQIRSFQNEEKTVQVSG